VEVGRFRTRLSTTKQIEDAECLCVSYLTIRRKLIREMCSKISNAHDEETNVRTGGVCCKEYLALLTAKVGAKVIVLLATSLWFRQSWSGYLDQGCHM
jgi:hypothetical protein